MIEIKFDKNSQESIKKALHEYKKLIKDNKVFYERGYVVKFIEIDASTKEENIAYEYQFFDYALEYDELEEDILQTLKEVINYTRDDKELLNLNMPDDRLFGLESLYHFVYKYKDYFYLLGAYFSGCADIEHDDLDTAVELFEDIQDNEIGEKTLKFLCYCDSENVNCYLFRSWINEETWLPFREYFNENKDKYEWFKETLKQRFKEYEYVGFSKSPIEDLYRLMMPFHETEDEDEDGEEYYYDKTFVYDTAKNEAIKLEKEIVELVGRSRLYGRRDLDLQVYKNYNLVFEDISQSDEAYEEHKELFLKGIENGEQLLAYIEEGKNKELLDEIKPVNIKKIAEEKNLSILKWLEFYGYGPSKLSSSKVNKNDSMETMLDWFLIPYSRDVSSFDCALRMIDVLIRLYEKKELNTDELRIIVDQLELCSKEEAIKRFSISELSKEEVYEKLESIICQPFIDSLRLEKLEEIYRVFKIDSKLFIEILVSLIKVGNSNIDEDILAAVPRLADEKKNASGFELLAIGYIVNKYLKENKNDQESVSKLIALYEQEIFDAYFSKIKKRLKTSFNIEINEYVKNFDNFNIVKGVVEDSTKSSMDEVYSALDELFYTNIEEGKEETASVDTIFSMDMKEDLPAMMASMLYMGEVVSTDLKLKLKKAFEIIFTLYPSVTVYLTLEEFSKEGGLLDRVTPENILTYCECLKTIGFDEKYDFFVKLTVCLSMNRFEDSIYEYKNKYGVRDYYFGLLEAYKKNQGEPKVVEVIELLPSEFKEKFFKDIAQFENKNE